MAPKGAAPKGKIVKVGADGSVGTVRFEGGGRARAIFHASVDASGSMKGERTDEAIKGLGAIYHSVMKPKDLFGLATFDGRIQRLHQCMTKSKVDWAKDERHIRANGGGLTALYDAIAHGMQELKDAKRYQREKAAGAAAAAAAPKLVPIQLVITDGQNNSGSTTLAQVQDLVARHDKWKNFRFYLVAVGVSDATAAQMATICRPAHAKLLRAGDVRELRRHLATVAEEIRAIITYRAANGAKLEARVTAKDVDQLQGMMSHLKIPNAIAAPGSARLALGGPAAGKPRKSPGASPRASPQPARKPCKLGGSCPYLPKGTCKFYHEACKLGPRCPHLAKGACKFYHKR